MPNVALQEITSVLPACLLGVVESIYLPHAPAILYCCFDVHWRRYTPPYLPMFLLSKAQTHGLLLHPNTGYGQCAHSLEQVLILLPCALVQCAPLHMGSALHRHWGRVCSSCLEHLLSMLGLSNLGAAPAGQTLTLHLSTFRQPCSPSMASTCWLNTVTTFSQPSLRGKPQPKPSKEQHHHW